jgi:hypothetical protein
VGRNKRPCSEPRAVPCGGGEPCADEQGVEADAGLGEEGGVGVEREF